MQKLVNNDIDDLIANANKFIGAEDYESAQTEFNKIKELPDDTGQLVKLGELAHTLGEYIAAINVYNSLIQMHPDNSSYYDKLAQVHIDNRAFDEAITIATESLRMNTECHIPYAQLGFIALERCLYDKAVEPLEKAFKLKPSDVSTCTNLIIALIEVNRLDEGYELSQKLIRLAPKNASAHHLTGVVLKRMGKFDEAIKSFNKAIQLNPGQGTSYYDLASSKKFTSANDPFVKKAEKVLGSSLIARERSNIHFALGKVYDDSKNWDAAFEHFKQANLLGKKTVKSEDAALIINKTQKIYSEQYIKEISGLNICDSSVPVFVVGMPRSGTTLIEQIISRHPEGAGAGELTRMNYIHSEICHIDKLGAFKEMMQARLDDKTLMRLADEYIDLLKDIGGDKKRVVDKMYDNYIYLGLIAVMFPNASIIHAVRNPLDVCLSCFNVPFDQIDWSYDLTWIAERYKFYRAAMAYWKKVIPANRSTDIHYESMVADQETESRKLIDAIGLEWSDNCLEYHKDDKTVSTASVWQVRQPIYKSSSKRWINYAQHLEPLASEIYEYLDDDDIQAFADQGIKLKKKGWLSSMFG